jgi:hypothetical protein
VSFHFVLQMEMLEFHFTTLNRDGRPAGIIVNANSQYAGPSVALLNFFNDDEDGIAHCRGRVAQWAGGSSSTCQRV